MTSTLRLLTLVGLCALLGVLACGRGQPVRSDESDRPADWRELLARRLPAYGHRNWIVIADAAYPSQSRPGIETVVTGAEQLEVVKVVLDQLARSKHVRPNVYLDAELPHVAEEDARGIHRYRLGLKRLLGKRAAESLPHERIIDRLDKAAEQFHVLVLKTTLTLPYTSVFVELDCGYWTPEAERRLRKAMKGEGKKR
jgi:hypothetical protein